MNKRDSNLSLSPSPFMGREIGWGVPLWVSSYVGIPFRSHGRGRSGCDCYGLVALVLEEVFGLRVPSYAADYLDATDSEEIAALIAGEIRSRWKSTTPPCFLPHEWGGTKGEVGGSKGDVAPGDAIVLRIAGRAWHVGVVIDPAGWFLHTRPGSDSCLERFDSFRWARRIMGFYRYAG